MSIDTLTGVRDVVIQTAANATDRYSDTILDWSAPTEVETTGWLAQVNTATLNDHRDGVVTAIVLTLRAGTAIGPHNRVVIDGVTYEVDGEPNRAWTPRGEHHVEVSLRAVVG